MKYNISRKTTWKCMLLHFVFINCISHVLYSVQNGVSSVLSNVIKFPTVYSISARISGVSRRRYVVHDLDAASFIQLSCLARKGPFSIQSNGPGRRLSGSEGPPQQFITKQNLQRNLIPGISATTNYFQRGPSKIDPK